MSVQVSTSFGTDDLSPEVHSLGQAIEKAAQPARTEGTLTPPSLPTWIPTIMLGAGLLLLAIVLTTSRAPSGRHPSRAQTLDRLRGWFKPSWRLQRHSANLHQGRATGGGNQADLGPAVLAASQAEMRLRSLVHDVEELSQRLAIEMDDRAGRLEDLLVRIDDRITKLGATATQGGHSSIRAMAEPTSPHPDARGCDADHLTLNREGHEAVVQRPFANPTVTIRPDASRQALENTPVVVPINALSDCQRDGPANPSDNPRERLALQVSRLAGEGLSALEIAQRLNQHPGKVELILALRKRP